MPYAFLGVTLLGALAVVNAYRPVRREPMTVPSFFAGWIVGELPLQNLTWQMAATVVFGVFGAFAAWPGWLGLAVAVAGWAGLVGLAVAGQRAGRVVAEALGQATGRPFPAVPVPPAPAWGRWWQLTRAVPLRSRSAELVKDVDYWGDGIHRHRLDVIRPRDIRPRDRPAAADRGAPSGPDDRGPGTAGRGAPVMVYVHGGAWVIGDKREQGKPMLYELVARGWVCVAVNYRLSPRATWPDHVVDVKRALAWVKEHIADYGGDPGFVAISGGSAGGHLAALAALTAGDATWQPGFEGADTAVAACVPCYGVMDMTGDRSGSGKYGPGLLRLLERLVMKASAADHPEVFEAASPTLRVHDGAPPFFVLHGANDTLVPVDVARQFVAALRRVSTAPVAYAELPLAQHAFDVLASLRCQATTAGVVAFLDAVRLSALRGQLDGD
ncbi:MAG TPA: alpha/beta hydrolase [Acidimicrobiales bacterium]|nr:alpha/beta hydrolase [Acidimicrobiales bacterium]